MRTREPEQAGHATGAQDDPDALPPRRPGSTAPAAQAGTTRGKVSSATHTAASPAQNVTKKNKGPDSDEPLSHEDKILLRACESDIQQNLQGFFVLGYRLWQINQKRLYRKTHKTFEAYCAEKWDFSKSHANRLIQAHLCIKHLEASHETKVYCPTNESHVRCIADLNPEQQVEVAAEVLAVIGDKRARAKDFRAAKEKLFPKAKRKTKSKPANVAAAEKVAATNARTLIEFDTNLVSLSVLKKCADDIYDTFTKPFGKQEGLKLIGQLQRDLNLWANWQAKYTKATAKTIDIATETGGQAPAPRTTADTSNSRNAARTATAPRPAVVSALDDDEPEPEDESDEVEPEPED